MINKLIENQLKKCKVANVGDYDDNNHLFIIHKYEELHLEENSCYLISLDDDLLNPNTHDTLSCNWNKGTHPKYKYLKIDVSKVMGTMINVNSLAYDFENKVDINEMWSGWLPLEKIKLIEKL